MSHYLAIDIETSGPGVISHRMVALGAVVDVATQDIVHGGEFRKLADFGDHSAGRPYDWDERTYSEFWTNKDQRKDGETPLSALLQLAEREGVVEERDMMIGFVTWARTMFEIYPELVIVTDTAAFDTTFVNVALDRHTNVRSLLYMRGATNTAPCATSARSTWASASRHPPKDCTARKRRPWSHWASLRCPSGCAPFPTTTIRSTTRNVLRCRPRSLRTPWNRARRTKRSARRNISGDNNRLQRKHVHVFVYVLR